MNTQARPPIPPPGPHGGDAARIAAVLGRAESEMLDLSVSLNPFAPDAAPLVRRHADAARRYPDVAEAERLLAEHLALDPARVVLSAGAAQAITLVAAEHPVGWVEPPDFTLYATALRELRPGAPSWRSDPHNPSGRLAAPGDRAAVRDEAFYPLATGRWTRGDGDAIALGSLTKVFAAPGLRLGFVVARDPDEAARLRGRRPQWAVGGLECAVLADLLAVADLSAWSARIARARADLAALLRRADYDPVAADAPWVLVPRSDGLRDRLAHEGVVVRDCASFGLEATHRIAVPDDDGLERLERALEHARDHARGHAIGRVVVRRGWRS
jgi:histidinol-phosphate/aromatic aminotransferase/cobyric acid decarboxylase-like protein